MKRVFINFFLLVSLVAHSQVDLLPDRFEFESELNYNESITSPEGFLGHELGERYTLYADVVSYIKVLSAQSARIKIGEYGETYEGRKLYYLTVTSEENHKNLMSILSDNNKLAHPENISISEANHIIKTKPVLINLSYNIHGNEPSTTEAALQVAYRMAAAQDAQTKEALDKSVIIMYMCVNPDGRDRYVYWYNGARRGMTATDPYDLDHHAPWPNGRTNHYWFDLNRDWIWGVHPEMRGLTEVYQDHLPQLHADYHEQGYNNNYFTMPGTTPRNKLLPDQYESLTDTIGMANVAAFDKHKVNYFTREAFDFFYPGYGSSYPTVMGAVGMLTEQGGIGGGIAIENNDGYVLTYRQRVFDHYTTSIATIKKAVEQKELFNRYFYNACDHRKSKSNTKAYIVRNEKSGHLKEFLNVLLRNRIKVYQANQSFSVNGAYDYRKGNNTSARFNAGDYIIPTNNSRHLLTNTIMTHQMEIEDSVMYDMSTWSAPMAYNLEAYSTSRSVSTSMTEISDLQNEDSAFDQGGDVYAYLIDYAQTNAPKALSLLWQKGYRVRIATKPFSNDGQSYSRGTLIVLRGRNLDKDDQISKDMEEISKKAEVQIKASGTGRSESGIDLASRDSEVLKPVKAAMLVDAPFSTYTAGQIYYLFDYITHFGLDRIRAGKLEQTSLAKLGSRYGYADLYDYDVLVLPGGGSGLRHVFDKDASKGLKEWIADGGTLVVTESAASYFTEKEGTLWSAKLSNQKQDSSKRAKTLAYDERRDYYGKKRIPGAALNSKIDLSHPLAFGMKSSLYTLKFGSNALEPATDIESVGMYDTNANTLMASGYAPKKALSQLAGKTFAAVDHIGDGKIIYLMENTQYRMFWKGPSRMMQNAVMIMPSVR